jgi:hypothetical protein
MSRSLTLLQRTMRALLKPVIAVLALVLVFEEWLWDGLQALVHRLSGWPVVHRLECWLRGLSPWGSLLVMLLPALALLPFKVAALWALGHGHPWWGLFTLLMAKLTGTALAAYLFDLVRERARQLAWFNTFYTAVLRLLQRAKDWLWAQPAYVTVRTRVADARAWLRSRWLRWRLSRSVMQRSVWSRRVRRAKARLSRFWSR